MHDEGYKTTEASPPVWEGDGERRWVLPCDLRELERGPDPTPNCWKYPVLLSAPL